MIAKLASAGLSACKSSGASQFQMDLAIDTDTADENYVLADYVVTHYVTSKRLLTQPLLCSANKAKASGKCKWPAWLVYDQNFRIDVAGNSSQGWA